MPETSYNHVISEIKTLNLSDQLRLLEETVMLIRKKQAVARRVVFWN